MICADTTEQSCADKAAAVGPHAWLMDVPWSHGARLRVPPDGLACRLAGPTLAQGLRWGPVGGLGLHWICRQTLARRRGGVRAIGPWREDTR